MATQTLMFLFDGAGGPATIGLRLAEAYGGMLAAHGRLIRGGLAADGG